MAITLDELLGRNTQSASQESVERFPSYEDFKARNSAYQYTQQSAQQGYRYNFDMAPAQAPRSVRTLPRNPANIRRAIILSTKISVRAETKRIRRNPLTTHNIPHPSHAWSKCPRRRPFKPITAFTISRRRTPKD